MCWNHGGKCFSSSIEQPDWFCTVLVWIILGGFGLWFYALGWLGHSLRAV